MSTLSEITTNREIVLSLRQDLPWTDAWNGLNRAALGGFLSGDYSYFNHTLEHFVEQGAFSYGMIPPYGAPADDIISLVHYFKGEDRADTPPRLYEEFLRQAIDFGDWITCLNIPPEAGVCVTYLPSVAAALALVTGDLKWCKYCRDFDRTWDSTLMSAIAIDNFLEPQGIVRIISIYHFSHVDIILSTAEKMAGYLLTPPYFPPEEYEVDLHPRIFHLMVTLMAAISPEQKSHMKWLAEEYIARYSTGELHISAAALANSEWDKTQAIPPEDE